MLYLDLTILSVQQFGGISTVWREYVRRLGAHFDADEVTLLTPKDVWAEVEALNCTGFQMRRLAPRGRLTKYAPMTVVGSPKDVLHTSYYQAAPLFRGARVVTVHDLTHHKLGRGPRRVLHQSAMRTALADADVVIAPSRATAADLRTRLRYRGRLDVIPHGVDREVFYPQPDDALSASPYLLWVGRRDWYRDFTMAVEAVRWLRQDQPEWQLRVTGESGPRESWSNWVVFEGTVDEDRLRRLYSSAQALTYLSRSEGFGLPILEAQSCGCPVIAYREPACVETAGDGATWVDSCDAEALARAASADNKDVVEHGFRNCMKYQWASTIELLGDTYESAT